MPKHVFRLVSRFTGIHRFALAVRPLGADRRARSKLYLAALSMPIKERVPGLRSARIRLRLRDGGSYFECQVRVRTDLMTLREVFLAQEYALPDDLEPRVILDLGANIGAAAIYFHLKYPQATIHALEPAAETFALMQDNVRQFPRMHAHRLAVAGANGRAAFYTSREASKATLLAAVGGDGEEEVETCTLARVMETLGLDRVDLVKVDIEGAEHEVFQAFHEMDRIGLVIGELHAHMIPATVDEFLSLFEGCETSAEFLPMPASPDAQCYIFKALQA
jgi:FkbM family methyltransferase